MQSFERCVCVREQCHIKVCMHCDALENGGPISLVRQLEGKSIALTDTHQTLDSSDSLLFKAASQTTHRSHAYSRNSERREKDTNTENMAEGKKSTFKKHA